ncbi:MAG: putative sigma regulatory protein MucB/RseB [Frankiales bacterium]|nr:putative sigma regulatory protein MucB/RseB [Frankiales bacterium]
MSRLRLLLLVAGLGALVTSPAAHAAVAPAPELDGALVASSSTRAVALLESAARSARTRTWSGTQQVVSTRSGEPRRTVLEIQHTPGSGSTVRVLSSLDHALAPDVLDDKLLTLLAGHYDLRVVAGTVCAGHRARVVEARRPGVTGPAGLAGRFWLDAATDLVLRRDVFDGTGAVVRSSTLVNLTVGRTAPATSVDYTAGEAVRPTGQRLDEEQLTLMEAAGWPVVRTLPSGLELFEARLHDEQVLQLSYSDGLSTLSLFVQKGELPDHVPGVARSMGGGTVRISSGSTERVVWSGDGRTWTLVSDAPESMVQDAVLVLPHAPAAVTDDGVLSRAWRGMSRVGSWLNPFE